MCVQMIMTVMIRKFQETQESQGSKKIVRWTLSSGTAIFEIEIKK